MYTSKHASSTAILTAQSLTNTYRTGFTYELNAQFYLIIMEINRIV